MFKKNYLYYILPLFLMSSGTTMAQQYAVPSSSVVQTTSNKKEMDRFIKSLMSRMTLEEKIGQLSQYVGHDLLTGPQSEALSDSLLSKGAVGSILNIGGVQKIKKIQEKNMSVSRLKIPILFAYDVIHGYRTIFPTPLAEACSWDLDLMYETAKAASIEASASGIHWTFAPMVDIARDPRWGRVVEGAGEDTYLGCVIAQQRVKGFQWNLWQPNSVLACAKHFAAYGAPQAGRDYAPVDMSNSTLAEVYLPPYKACVDAGVQTFMAAFNDVNGLPAHGSKWLLTDILRKQWNFKGFVVSDWNGVQQLTTQGVVANDKGAAVLALNAGVDMNMTDGVYNKYLKEAVKDKEMSIDVINESVYRILAVKYKLGLFTDPYRFCDESREKKEIMSDNVMALARKAAQRSIVLLQNKDNILPLKSNVKKVALVGPLAANQAELLGSWKAFGLPNDVVSVQQGLKNKWNDKVVVNYAKGCDFVGEDTSGFDEAVKVAQESDVIIAVMGEKALMSGESRSRAKLNLPGVQEQLLERLAATGKPVVVVLMNGRPLVLTNVMKYSNAIIESWFLGTQTGNALADVLTGDYNPSAKLTTSFPQHEGQIPNYYNYKRSGRPGDMEHSSTVRHIDLKNANLFPFGFGLSYTTYKYDAPK
ncbi:glycoside hydrolase family 3 N-terminal domain-containing protein, partial [Hoylesella shahii]